MERYLAVTGGLAIAAFSALFFLSRDARLKRRLWPFFNVLAVGAGLAAFGASTGWRSWQPLLWAVPFALVAWFFNFRSLKFCTACGRTVRMPSPFKPLETCPGCGELLR